MAGTSLSFGPIPCMATKTSIESEKRRWKSPIRLSMAVYTFRKPAAAYGAEANAWRGWFSSTPCHRGSIAEWHSPTMTTPRSQSDSRSFNSHCEARERTSTARARASPAARAFSAEGQQKP